MKKIYFILFLGLLICSTASFSQPLTAVFPQVNRQTHISPIEFQWNKANDAISYDFYLASDSLFSNIIFQTNITNNYFTYSNAITSGIYFWKVSANFSALPTTHSSTYKFTFFAPTPNANLKLWFAADTGVTLTSGAVSQWNDLSGNNFNLNQSTISFRPIKTLNSLTQMSTVKFDGTNDYLSVNFSQTFNQPLTYFYVWNTQTAKVQYLFDGILSTNRVTMLFSTATTLSPFAGSQLNYTKKFDTIPFITTAVYNGTSSIFYENGIQKLIGNPGNGNSTGLNLGAKYSNNQTLDGCVSEILIFNTILVPIQKTQIEEYLSNKYGPPVSLGYDISMQYRLCDTTLASANKPWFSKWLWNSGDTTATIKVNKTGKYWVKATNIFGITSSDTIIVTYKGAQTFSNSTICLGDTLTYTYTKNLPYNITWSNGDTGIVFKTTMAGNYSMTLRDTNNCTYQTSFIVAIDSFPSRNFINSDTTICSGNTIKANIISGTTSLIWLPGNETTLIKTIYNSGMYKINATNTNGCVNNDSINVVVSGSAPNPLFNWSKLCSRDSITFTDLSYPADSIASWQWTINNNFSSNIQNPVTTFDTAGNYSVHLSVTAHSGCLKDTTVFIHLNKKPTADFSYLNPCPNIPTPFTNLSDLGIGYTTESINWFINSNLVSTETSPQLSFPASQIYNVSLKVTSTDLCSDSITKSINIPANYPQPLSFSTIYPLNNAQLSIQTVVFKWNISQNAQYYKIEISKFADFNTIYNSASMNAVNSPSYTLNLDTGMFYWRVTAYNPCLDSIRSEKSSFRILPLKFSRTALWFAADSGVVISNGLITQWKDISGNNNHANQSTIANQPLLVSTNSILNNKPSINFDGTNDNFVISNTTNIGSVFIISNWGTTATVFPNAVSMLSSYIAHPKLILFSGAQNTSNIYTSTSSLFGNNIEINNNSTSLYSPLNAYKLIFGKVATSSVQYPSLQIAGQTSTTGRYWNGNIAEIIAFDTVLTVTEQDQVYSYLSNKYAPYVSLGYDINMQYRLCDTTITGANKAWFTNWIWNTGETTATIKVNKTGNYWVKATNIFGLESYDTVFVYYAGQQTFVDTTLCLGDTLHYSYTKNLPYTISWSNGNNGLYFKEANAGTYSMTLTDTIGCHYTTSFTLHLDSLPTSLSLGTDLSFCSGETLSPIIQNQDMAQLSYTWMNNTTLPSIMVSSAGNYSVTATNERGCIAIDSIDITIQGALPIVQFNAAGVCWNEISHFQDQSTSPDGSNLTSWSWTFGNDSVSNLPNPQLTYLNSGIFTVKLSVTTENLCTSSFTQQVVVYSKPNSDFTPLEACAFSPVQFTDLTTDNYQIHEWLWNFNDAYSTQNTSSLQNPIHSFDNIGNYQIKLISKSIFGCTDSITKSLIVKPTVLSDFSFSNSCFGTPTWFNNTSITNQWNPIMKYKWEYLSTYKDSLPTSSYLFSAPGIYNVKHTITTLNGCTNSIIKPIKVSYIPIANFSNPETCLNTTYILNDESQIEFDTISIVKWFIDGNYYSSGTQTYVDFPSPNSYIIKQIVISNENCSDTISKTVIVNPVPVSNFTYTFDEETVGYLVHFTNTSTGINSYFWDFSTGQTSTAVNPSYDFTTEGNYNVVLIAQNQYGCTDTSNYVVFISNPFMDLSILNASFENINGYLKTNISIANMGNRNVFNIWIDVMSGNTNTRELWSGILRPAEVINYTLHSYTPIKPYENIEFACASIYADMFPNELNMVNNNFCISNSDEFSIFDIYPNPAKEKITCILSTPNDGLIQIKISRPDGKLVFESNSNNVNKGINHFTIPISNLPSGVYFIHLEFEGKRLVQKFVVI